MKNNQININTTTNRIEFTPEFLAPLCAALLIALSGCSEESPPGNAIDSGIQSDSGLGNAGSSGVSDSGADAAVSSNPDGGDAAVACVIDTAAADGCGNEPVEIAGEYSDDFGFTTLIEDCAIYGSPVTTLSNQDQYMVTQNSCDDLFVPGLWSRHDWTWQSGDGGEPDLYICTQIYDAATEAAAIAAPRADENDLLTGCGEGGFAWTKLEATTVLTDAGLTADAGDGG